MAELGYDGKVAIITGAGGGLGRQHALLMASRGALVVVNDLGGSVDGTGASTTAAQKVVDEIKALGGEAVADTNSVATPEGGEAIVQTAIDAFGRVSIAGMSAMPSKVVGAGAPFLRAAPSAQASPRAEQARASPSPSAADVTVVASPS